MITLVLADDEALTRGAVGALLGLEGDLRIVAEASTGDEAVEVIRVHAPDVAVLDVEMPGRDGAEVAQWVAENQPGTRCIVLTRHARPGVLRRALAAGAAGFVTKSAPASVLADVVRRVHGGGRYVDPDLAMTALTSEDCPLTDRELEVLRNVDDSGTANDIARRVHLSPGTVRNYLSSAMQKLGAGSRSEAARLARDHGWL
ncbi:DNA-binding response regulator [Pseudonocardia benzenivorans]|uniref:Two component transcriptional regulator, LuxR family n=2 Tax=Pseudonocardia TaxID=1847 RepID=F4CWG3_PSEUX|nr:response regulator transcription factor [Pseudonocardia dioxanivorans]AEA28655.1 two component transcriptional regulator, LuxR family [Pseudonocardia dioxanivorans CB1190]GJF05614.1 DNA-binding response regulator [Pseudonocardia sp. D17]